MATVELLDRKNISFSLSIHKWICQRHLAPLTTMFYLTNCPTMELGEPPCNGSVVFFNPTVLCMWKLMISSVQTLITGVPQGSILGVLLFLIYMNDLSNSRNLFKFISFADYTNLFSTIEYTLPAHASNVNELLNNEFANIYEWLTVIWLSLNSK